MNADILNQLKVEEHYLSLHSQLQRDVNMMERRAGSDTSSAELALLKEFEVESIRRQVYHVNKFPDGISSLKLGLQEELKKQRFVICIRQ